MTDIFIEPRVTDPAIDRWPTPHYVSCDTAVPHRGQLVLFMPGTRGTPSMYTTLANEAAKAGFHAVNLSYSNDKAIEWEICRKSDDPDCLEKVRLQQLEGGNHSSGIEVSRANSMEYRLLALLRHLDREYPDEQWGQFIDGDSPEWKKVVATGHSQGGGAAAMTGKYRDVARVVMFAWCDMSNGETARWINADTVTPIERFFAFRHVEDRIDSTRKVWKAFGLEKFGPEVNVDDIDPPYGDSHMLVSSVPVPEGLSPGRWNANLLPHLMVILDEHLLRKPDGSPLYLDAWRYLWGVGRST